MCNRAGIHIRVDGASLHRSKLLRSYMELPLIGITMGDPAGVGPEVIVKALSHPEIFQVCRPVVLGDSRVISRACHILHMDLQVKETGNIGEEIYQPGHIHVFNLSNIEVDTLKPGRIDERFGKAIIDYISAGTRLAMEGKIKAVTTAPINKELLHKAGYAYAGHTELLAELTNTRDYVMMLSGQKLKVALVTTHCRLNDVGSLLDVPKIHTVIHLTDDSLRKYFAIPQPRIAVASLNPHGGEGGIFGDE